MKTLLTSIQTRLKAQMTYIKVVEIVPDYYVFSETAGFPLIGILDSGEELIKKEKGARVERLKVGIGLYQAIAKTEASVIGDGRNKGILEMADDACAALRNQSFGGTYQNVTFKMKSKTQALENRDYKGFIAFKSIDIEFFREVIEAT